MGIFKRIFGGAIFKTSVINTFSSFSSSTDNREHHRLCEFLHKIYEDGNHEIEVKISQGNPMKFKLLSEPVSIGEDVMMFDLGSENGDIIGIDLMMKASSAYIKFPDDTMISFKN